MATLSTCSRQRAKCACCVHTADEPPRPAAAQRPLGFRNVCVEIKGKDVRVRGEMRFCRCRKLSLPSQLRGVTETVSRSKFLLESMLG